MLDRFQHRDLAKRDKFAANTADLPQIYRVSKGGWTARLCIRKNSLSPRAKTFNRLHKSMHRVEQPGDWTRSNYLDKRLLHEELLYCFFKEFSFQRQFHRGLILYAKSLFFYDVENLYVGAELLSESF